MAEPAPRLYRRCDVIVTALVLSRIPEVAAAAREALLGRLVGVIADRGAESTDADLAAVLDLASALPDARPRVRVIADVCAAVARAGLPHEAARRLLETVATQAAATADPVERIDLARFAAAGLGDLGDRALAVQQLTELAEAARALEHSDDRGRLLSSIAIALATAGATELALIEIDRLPLSSARVRVLARATECAADPRPLARRALDELMALPAPAPSVAREAVLCALISAGLDEEAGRVLAESDARELGGAIEAVDAVRPALLDALDMAVARVSRTASNLEEGVGVVEEAEVDAALVGDWLVKLAALGEHERLEHAILRTIAHDQVALVDRVGDLPAALPLGEIVDALARSVPLDEVHAFARFAISQLARWAHPDSAALIGPLTRRISPTLWQAALDGAHAIGGEAVLAVASAMADAGATEHSDAVFAAEAAVREPDAARQARVSWAVSLARRGQRDAARQQLALADAGPAGRARRELARTAARCGLIDVALQLSGDVDALASAVDGSVMLDVAERIAILDGLPGEIPALYAARLRLRHAIGDTATVLADGFARAAIRVDSDRWRHRLLDALLDAASVPQAEPGTATRP